ncbi:MAG: TolC family protein [Acidobacteriota bacterium]|nr:TolC family protein [Acidobacteriota bacterium]
MRQSCRAGHRGRAWLGWALAALLLVWPQPRTEAAEAARERPIVRIGAVVDGPWQGNEGLRERTEQEILNLTEGEFDVRFPEAAYRVGDWTLEAAENALAELLEDSQIDLVITWGLLASQTTCCQQRLPKPVIAPVIIDADLQGLPSENGASGVPNLNYVALPDKLPNELQALHHILPFDNLALLLNANFAEGIPELSLRILKTARKLGVGLELIPVGNSVEDVLDRISETADAAYLFPLFHLPPDDLQRLVDGLHERGVMTFSAVGGQEMESGILATRGNDEFLERLARRVALNVQRILLGEDAGSIPVAFSVPHRLALNLATARELGVSPRWEALLEAEILEGGEIPGARRETFAGAVQRAIEQNLDLAAQRRSVAAGEQDVRRARSVFWPSLEVSGTALQIDEDRAAASFGSQPEQSFTAGLTATQLLYSDGARANAEIQRQLQLSREEELAVLRLDIAFEAATAYLDLLRAKTLEQIRLTNLQVTRENLELARLRRRVGTANPAEVYRWESQIATDQQALVEARSTVSVAEIALNRLLHYDLEAPFTTAEVGLDDPYLITSQERFQGYIETPKLFSVLRDFAVQEGLSAAPELRSLRAAIAAQERAVTAARRAYWAPTASARFTLDERLAESGAGTSGGMPLPGLPTADDTNWSLGLAFSLPLFEGGARRADELQAEQELAALELRWEAAVESLELRIRAATYRARASFVGIGLSRRSAEAAEANLELVADAYARGAVSVIELLDAQAAALNAAQGATNAVYDFFIDLMEVQRAINRFDFFISPDARDAWFQRLDLFFTEAGVKPLRP